MVLLKRGYRVDLFEKNNELNKIGKLTTIFGFDKALLEYYEYIEKQIDDFFKDGKLVIYKNKEFSRDVENIDKYYSIIIATGFNTKLLSITGAVQPHVQNIYDCLNNEKLLLTKKYIVLYAKSELSLKLAFYLLTNNKDVTVIIKDLKSFIENKNSTMFYYFYSSYVKRMV